MLTKRSGSSRFARRPALSPGNLARLRREDCEHEGLPGRDPSNIPRSGRMASSREAHAAGTARTRQCTGLRRCSVPLASHQRSGSIISGHFWGAFASCSHLDRSGSGLSQRSLHVLRGALVGASQSVWILASPDRVERRERGLTLIGERYQRLRKSSDEMASLSLTPDEQAQLTAQIAWCEERQSQVTALRSSRSKLVQTSVIDLALQYRFADQERRGAGRLL